MLVERGGLVRVLAVAEWLDPVPRGSGPGREAGAVGLSDRVGVRRRVALHPVGDGGVVGRGMRKGLRSQPLSLREGETAGTQRLDDPRVGLRAGYDRDARVVLGGRAHHRRATDVDLLDALLGARSGGNRVAERVEVRHDEVEGLDVQLLELSDVVGVVRVGEDPRMHLGVQRLDPTVQALGETGQLLDRRDRDA